MVVLAGDINGLVGSSNVGYNGMHGGFGYGDRNADGSRILELAEKKKKLKMQKTVKCGVCGRGFGNNSIQYYSVLVVRSGYTGNVV